MNFTTVDMFKLGASYLNRLERDEIFVVQLTNKNEAMDRMEAIRDYPVSNPLSPRLHDFTEGESFWLLLRHKGEDIGGVAAKISDIGRESVQSYWQRTLTRQFFPLGDGNIEAMDVSEILKMRGKVVYLGDLFLRTEYRGCSERLLSIMRLLFVTVAAEWNDLDWVYSFLRNEDASKAQFYGFTDILDTPLSWSEPRSGRSNDEQIAAMSRARLMLKLSKFLHQIRHTGSNQ